MATNADYNRLGGRSFGVLRRSSLWLASDHILLVSTIGFVESYKRFYLRDIQAVTIEKVDGIPLPVRITILLALAALSIWNYNHPFIAGGLAVVMLFYLYRVLRGPRCVCYVQTAVNRDRLPSLRVLQTAQNALYQLHPHIQQAQADILPEVAAPSRAQPVRPAAPPQVPYDGRVHEALFWMLLFQAAVVAFDLAVPLTWMWLVLQMLSAAELVLVLAAVVKQHKTALSASLKRVTWVALARAVLSSVASFSLAMYNATSRGPSVAALYGPQYTARQMTILNVSALVSLLPLSAVGLWLFYRTSPHANK